MRRFFVENAVYWLSEYDLDGLRLDAVQTIQDDSPQHIVAECGARHEFSEAAGRTVVVAVKRAESSSLCAACAGGGRAPMQSGATTFTALSRAVTGERKGYVRTLPMRNIAARAK